MNLHPSVKQLLQYFDDVPSSSIIRPISIVAYSMASELEGPELAAGLRKLLEAKDCFERATVAHAKKV